MLLTYTESFKRSYKKLPKFIQKKADRILLLLGEDLMHPSIRAKKIQGLVIFGKAGLINSIGLLL